MPDKDGTAHFMTYDRDRILLKSLSLFTPQPQLLGYYCNEDVPISRQDVEAAKAAPVAEPPGQQADWANSKGW